MATPRPPGRFDERLVALYPDQWFLAQAHRGGRAAGHRPAAPVLAANHAPASGRSASPVLPASPKVFLWEVITPSWRSDYTTSNNDTVTVPPQLPRAGTDVPAPGCVVVINRRKHPVATAPNCSTPTTGSAAATLREVSSLTRHPGHRQRPILATELADGVAVNRAEMPPAACESSKRDGDDEIVPRSGRRGRAALLVALRAGVEDATGSRRSPLPWKRMLMNLLDEHTHPADREAREGLVRAVRRQFCFDQERGDVVDAATAEAVVAELVGQGDPSAYWYARQMRFDDDMLLPWRGGEMVRRRNGAFVMPVSPSTRPDPALRWKRG